jgi:hypothetical protein
MKKAFIIISAVLVCMLMTTQSYSQQTSSVSKSNMDKAGQWQSAKVNPDGTNMINGVEFYKKAMKEGEKTSLLLKLVNTNSYVVKVQWQESTTVTKEVIIAGNSTVEGNASSTDTATAENKLVLTGPITEDMKYFIQTTMQVIEVK